MKNQPKHALLFQSGQPRRNALVCKTSKRPPPPCYADPKCGRHHLGLAALLFASCSLAAAAQPVRLETLHAFELMERMEPRVVQGSDGNFYGTTFAGGNLDYGRVFRLTPDGVLTTLQSFHGSDGAFPLGGLVEGSDGNFYGTTRGGGSANYGTVFRVTAAGELAPLVSFNGVNGKYPYGCVVQGGDGNFYGTTSAGDGNYGTVFRVSPSGHLTTLATFNGTNGSKPIATLLPDGKGNFYGTTFSGGSGFDSVNSFGSGTVFKVTSDGLLTTLCSFDGTNGAFPRATLALGSDGDLYGTTSWGGTDYSGTGSKGAGTVFKVTSNGVLTQLASFSFDEPSKGAEPFAGLVQGGDGNFYGTTAFGGSTNNAGTLFRVTTNGMLTTFVLFDGQNGVSPSADLVRGRDGNFYGTTSRGGAGQDGTIFRMTPNGILTTLAPFVNGGASPQGLLEGTDGSLYGVTSEYGPYWAGTVFQLSPNGELTTLAPFNWENGGRPKGGLVQARDGNLYGTTSTADSKTGSRGTIFRVMTNGVLTTLFSFYRPNDGESPSESLLEGNDGYLYGTTPEGGANGSGTIFRLTTNGSFTTLASFGLYDLFPSRLVQGPDGTLYGETITSETAGYGTVFAVATNGAYRTLFSFSNAAVQGANPWGGLTVGRDGNLYGVTTDGGTDFNGFPDSGKGTVFKLTTNGLFTTLAYFSGADGAYPVGDLVEGSDGNFYGTTGGGGVGNYGTIFQLTTNGALTSLASFSGQDGEFPMNLMQARDGNFYGTTPYRTFDESSGFFPGYGPSGTIFRLNVVPRIVTQPLGQTNNADTTATFVVSAEGLGPLRYQWRKDETEIAGATAASLNLPEVQKGDEGSYSVVVSNAFGAVTSSNASLVVVLPDAGALLQRLLGRVNTQVPRPQPLRATLDAARASIERGSRTSALNQLRAFQNKVRAQAASLDPELARALIQTAQQVIDGL